MKVIRKALHMGLVWLLLSVSLWAAGTACLNNVVPASGASRFSIRFSFQNAPSFDGMEQYFDKLVSRGEKTAIPRIVTAWAEERNQLVSATEWKADASVDVYYVNGNVTDVMHLILLAGAFPVREDKTGISIDARTAVKLFGSSTPVGLAITLGGQKYTVRGIFECPKGIESFGADTGRGLAVLSPSSLTSGAASDFSAMKKIGVHGAEFIFPAGLSPDEAKSYAMQLAGEMGLGGAVFTKDYSARDKMLKQLAQLPGWSMMAVAILMLLYAAYTQTRMMLKLAWRRFRSRYIPEKTALYTMLRGVLWGFVMLAASAVIYLFIKPDFSLPPSYIPTQWSDVGFWPELIKKMMVEQAERNALPVARPDAVANTLTGWGIIFIAASLTSIYIFNSCLYKVLGRSVSTRLRQHIYEGNRPVAQWDSSCYLLLIFSAAAPAVGLKLADIIGLRPVVSGTALTMQVIPIVMVSVELIMRLWPSAFWPLRYSPIKKLRFTIDRLQEILIFSKNKSLGNKLSKNKNLEG